ncbi:SDR family NAD(P)-dependent oxidoreductase [Actinomycetota bacterium]
MIDTDLKGKVVLVTGGNNPQGIGAATARAFAMEGSKVFIHYFRHDDNVKNKSTCIEKEGKPGIAYFLKQQNETADKLVKSINDDGGYADSWECDLGNPKNIPALFKRAEESLGHIDILVNNAAEYLADTFIPESIMNDEELELWDGGPVVSTINTVSHDMHFAVNSRAATLLMAEFTRRHIEKRRKWGRIINITADCASGCPAEISYRASKYALESYSRSAAAELGPYGITVNIVSPGPIQTGYINTENEKVLIGEIPLRKLGEPEDIANAVIFFASQQSGWITGQLLFVHGGHRMSLGR